MTMFKRLLAPFAVVLVGVFALSGAACQRVDRANPVGSACKDLSENLAVCGYATYAMFVIFQELGARAAKERGVSPAVRDAIIRADAAAKPVADNLYHALQLYESVRAELQAGKSTQEKLDVATVNLNRWITEAAPLVAGLVQAVNGSKGAK
jgi:hypothetical protein